MTKNQASQIARSMADLIKDADLREINASTESEVLAAREQRASAYTWLREARQRLEA